MAATLLHVWDDLGAQKWTLKQTSVIVVRETDFHYFPSSFLSLFFFGGVSLLFPKHF